ncbi:MAG: hypothetical protein AB7U63_04785 [Porticoccaceae bacterium]
MYEIQSDTIMRDYLERIGFTPNILEGIGTVSVYAATIEFWIEKVTWNIEGINPAGMQPETDCKPISGLIKHLDKIRNRAHCEEVGAFIKKWCEIARLAFEVRNTMIHGFPIGISKNITFVNHSRWEGELRKKEATEFYADDNTLRMLRETFSVLARAIIYLEKITKEKIVIETRTEFTREFQHALSSAAELRYLIEFIANEKY